MADFSLTAHRDGEVIDATEGDRFHVAGKAAVLISRAARHDEAITIEVRPASAVQGEDS